MPVSKSIADFFCAICGKFVTIESHGTDSDGRTIHRECLAAERGAKKPPVGVVSEHHS